MVRLDRVWRSSVGAGLLGLGMFVALLLGGFGISPAAGEEAKDAAPAKANSAGRLSGHLIRIPLPITGRGDDQIMQQIEGALRTSQGAKSRPVIVLELWPAHSKFGEGSDFSRAQKLARYLSGRELSRAKTVAYIPQTIKGHAVLIALACEEIVMAPDAQLGAAGIDERADEAIDPAVRSGYREIANRRRTIPPEVALGMLDKDLEIIQIETEVSTEFVLRSQLEDRRAKQAIQNEKVLIPAGEMGLFSGREARKLGFVKYLATDRRTLAKALTLPAASLEEDPSLGGSWKPVRVALKGVITPQAISRAQRTISDQIELEGANFICLWIESPGGSLADSVALANYLSELDRSKVRTVAYVPEAARGDAALIAAACDEIVMHRDAALGGSGAQAFTADDVRLVRETIRENVAPKKSRSWSLAAALVDPALAVRRYTHRENGLVEYFSDEELAAQPDVPLWVKGAVVTRPGQVLTLQGPEAEELGLARHVVSNFAEFKQLYGLGTDLALVEPGWANTLIDALAAPGVGWLLLLIGLAALYAELHTPGVGFGGFVAGICFLLFFWNRYLEGTAGWLEVLLFVAGLTCILLELFVLPGTAIFGMGGGLLVLASIILASQTFVIPRNDYQLTQLRDSLLSLVAAGIGVVVLAVLMQRFLPRTPLFGHMVLEPPSGEELEHLSHREAMVELDYLLGQRGITTTPLLPSGKARFGGQLVDVTAEGEVIGRGSEVVVVQAHGNRVIVRSV